MLNAFIKRLPSRASKRIALVIIYALFLSVPVQANSPLRILTVNEPPASYLETSGQANGYAVDIIKAMQAVLADNTPIEFVPEARALNITRYQANILLFSFSRTVPRENNFLWLGKILNKKWFAYTLLSNHITIRNLQELHKVSNIGVVRGDIREEWLVNHKFENLYSVTHHNQNIQMLLQGRIDAMIYDQAGLVQACKQLSVDAHRLRAHYAVNESSVYIAMSKGSSTAIFSLWQNAFEQLRQDGTIASISRHWQTKLKKEFNIESDVINGILHF